MAEVVLCSGNKAIRSDIVRGMQVLEGGDITSQTSPATQPPFVSREGPSEYATIRQQEERACVRIVVHISGVAVRSFVITSIVDKGRTLIPHRIPDVDVDARIDASTTRVIDAADFKIE